MPINYLMKSIIHKEHFCFVFYVQTYEKHHNLGNQISFVDSMSASPSTILRKL